MTRAAALLATVLASGCVTTSASASLQIRRVPRTCPDGAPVKLLLGAACPEGICGYTCALDRWAPHPPGCP